MNRFLVLGALLVTALASPPRLVYGQQSSNPQAESAAAAVPAHLVVDGKAVGHRVESRDGEICITCGKPITKDDVTYLVDRQRVPVHKGLCLGALAAKPVEFLIKLKPRGAFLDAAASTTGVSAGWLMFGCYVLLGLIFSALAAHRAFSVGREPLTWLAIGFLTNIFGYAALLTLPRREVRALEGIPSGLGKVAATYAPEVCPACGAQNHPSARVCSLCGKSLAPHVESEVQKAGLATH